MTEYLYLNAELDAVLRHKTYLEAKYRELGEGVIDAGRRIIDASREQFDRWDDEDDLPEAVGLLLTDHEWQVWGKLLPHGLTAYEIGYALKLSERDGETGGRVQAAIREYNERSLYSTWRIDTETVAGMVRYRAVRRD